MEEPGRVKQKGAREIIAMFIGKYTVEDKNFFAVWVVVWRECVVESKGMIEVTWPDFALSPICSRRLRSPAVAFL